MAKGTYIGVGGKARKVRNLYLGVGGKARKVKKAYVGVGGKARLFFSASTYGVSWSGAEALPEGVSDLTYGNGTFVGTCGSSTADTKYVVYSYDGVTWKYKTNLPSLSGWQGIAYGNGVFVMLDDSRYPLYSTDGVAWEEASAPSYIGKAAYGNGKFVGVGISGTGRGQTAYSTNGIDWTAGSKISSNSDYVWNNIVFGNGIYMAVAGLDNRDIFACAVSADGSSWSVLYTDAFYTTDLVYGNGIFVAVGKVADQYDYAVMYSKDNGENWTKLKVGDYASGFRGFSAVTFTGDRFVAVPYGTSTQSFYSDDGENWIRGGDLPKLSQKGWSAAAFGGGKVVAVTDGVESFSVTE